jgi:ABC-type multidrug transport system fused ATPase/permease subunit
MRHDTPLVVLGIGIVLLILGLSKILPGATGMGGGLAFLGILLFALSFVKKPEVKPGAAPPMGPFEQTLGMYYEPAEVFRNLKIHPRWLVAALLISIAGSIYSFAFVSRITPERIASYMSEKLKGSGFPIPEDKIEEMRSQQIADAKSPVKRIGTAVNSFVAVVTLMAFLATIYLLGALMFGGRINFWQGMAIATHAALPIVLLQKLLSLAILYVKAPEYLHPTLNQSTLIQDNLGVLFSPAQNPVLFAAGSTIGILTLYGVWLTATGIKNGGEGVSSAGGWTISIAIWFMLFLLAVCSALLFPGFIS